MKYKVTRKWNEVSESKNLLYFAQLLDELLFDFSLDTYKPSAMNTSLLCLEALEIIVEIDAGNIKRPNLQHILDELCENLKNDIVARELVNIDYDGVFSVLKNPKAAFRDKQVIVELLYKQIDLLKYKEKNEDLLVATILDQASTSSEIRFLARSYVTTLINIGYSAKRIYNLVQEFFFEGVGRISGNEAITVFLEQFKSEMGEYLVLYRGASVFKKISPSCARFNIEITKEKPKKKFSISLGGFKLRKDEVYIYVDKIHARDEYSAKEKAEEKLELLTTIYALFHHKQLLSYQSDCLVVDIQKQTTRKSTNSLNTMHKCIDHIPQRAAVKLNQFVSEFALEKQSFKKFTRSAELHSLALAGDSKENQMINLWIALESIIPTKNESKDVSNIQHILDSIIPFLSIGYLDRLISRFCKDLLNWNKGIVKKQIIGIHGGSLAEKVVKLMALPEYAGKRETMEAQFNDFHLLADRFSYFCSILSSPKNVATLLGNHNKRVGWQVRRIYRARNLIVHSGKTPSYTEILIENTHDYLDVVMGC